MLPLSIDQTNSHNGMQHLRYGAPSTVRTFLVPLSFISQFFFKTINWICFVPQPPSSFSLLCPVPWSGNQTIDTTTCTTHSHHVRYLAQEPIECMFSYDYVDSADPGQQNQAHNPTPMTAPHPHHRHQGPGTEVIERKYGTRAWGKNEEPASEPIYQTMHQEVSPSWFDLPVKRVNPKTLHLAACIL